MTTLMGNTPPHRLTVTCSLAQSTIGMRRRRRGAMKTESEKYIEHGSFTPRPTGNQHIRWHGNTCHHSLQEAHIPDCLQEEPTIQQGHGLAALPPLLLFTEVLHHRHERSTLKRRTRCQVHTCSGPCCPRGACANIELNPIFLVTVPHYIATQYPLLLLCCTLIVINCCVVVQR